MLRIHPGAHASPTRFHEQIRRDETFAVQCFDKVVEAKINPRYLYAVFPDQLKDGNASLKEHFHTVSSYAIGVKALPNEYMQLL